MKGGAAPLSKVSVPILSHKIRQALRQLESDSLGGIQRLSRGRESEEIPEGGALLQHGSREGKEAGQEWQALICTSEQETDSFVHLALMQPFKLLN
jgi:hypothetical protein